MAAATASFTLNKPISSTKCFSNSNSIRTSLLPLKTFNSNLKPLKLSTKISAKVISVGDKVPEATFTYIDTFSEVKTVTLSELTRGRKVVFMGLPGAYTRLRSLKGNPGFEDLDKATKDHDLFCVVSVNDPFVMQAFKGNFKEKQTIVLSDRYANFTKALGLEVDLTNHPAGLGIRSRRYSMVVEDRLVKYIVVEDEKASSDPNYVQMLFG